MKIEKTMHAQRKRGIGYRTAAQKYLNMLT